MNSLYGATGVRVGKLACLPIGASVTCEGRRTLEEVEIWMKVYFNATIIGGDTDSVFVSFPAVQTLADVSKPVKMLIDPDKPESETNTMIELPFYEHVVRFINRRQRPEKSMIIEKIIMPFNVFACKKSDYASNPPKEHPVTKQLVFELREKLPIESKGTENKRRSTAPYAKKIFDKFDKLLMSKIAVPLNERVKSAVEYVQGELHKILSGDFNYTDMIITSYYGKSEDQYSNPNHPTLVINRKRISRGEEPYQLGERVPRVIIRNPDPKAKMFQKVEDPLYAMKNKIPLDIEHYINKQLRLPLRRKIENINPALENEMFKEVDALKKKIKPTKGLYALLTRSCEFCKKLSSEPICNACLPNVTRESIKARFEPQTNSLKATIAKQHDVCYDCLGNKDRTGEIACDNVHCDELPRRVLPTADLNELKHYKQKLYELLQF